MGRILANNTTKGIRILLQLDFANWASPVVQLSQGETDI